MSQSENTIILRGFLFIFKASNQACKSFYPLLSFLVFNQKWVHIIQSLITQSDFAN